MLRIGAASVLLALFLSDTKTAEASTAFRLTQGPACSNGLAFSVQVMCDGSEYDYNQNGLCDLGEKALVTGTLTLPEDFSQTVLVSSKACLFGWDWDVTEGVFCNKYEWYMDVCDIFGLENSGCPGAGSYTIAATTFNIPGTGGNNYASGWWMGITSTVYAVDDDFDYNSYATDDPAEVEDEDGDEDEPEDEADGDADEDGDEGDDGRRRRLSTKQRRKLEEDADPTWDYVLSTCTSRVNAYSNPSSSSSSFFIGFGALLGMSALTALIVRRRRMAAIDLSREEDRAISGDFEMMTDAVRV